MTPAELRAQVFTALDAALTIPVFNVEPDELTTPCAWILSPIGLATAAPGSTVATVGVIVVVDGAHPGQLAAVDDHTARIWQMFDRMARTVPQAVTASDLDVGGPTLRAVTVTADTTVSTATLCRPLEVA